MLLQRPVANKIEHEMIVIEKHLEIGIDVIGEGLILTGKDMHNSIDETHFAVEIRQNLDVERIAFVHRWMNRMI